MASLFIDKKLYGQRVWWRKKSIIEKWIYMNVNSERWKERWITIDKLNHIAGNDGSGDLLNVLIKIRRLLIKLPLKQNILSLFSYYPSCMLNQFKMWVHVCMFKLKSLTWDSKLFSWNYGYCVRVTRKLIDLKHFFFRNIQQTPIIPLHTPLFSLSLSIFPFVNDKWNETSLTSFHPHDGVCFCKDGICVDYMHVHIADNIEIFTWSFIKIRHFLFSLSPFLFLLSERQAIEDKKWWRWKEMN